MPLTLGTRLGSYEITGPIGAGGMGQVWRARDTKLDRDVALKILPEAFVHDADRVARFTREAKTLAALSHPHIAGIYGLDENNGVTALVMELVEGEDLSQRLARGPIPVEEALAIARQIADALEAAHEQGIVHRDLKPANIKMREDGAVKVLDFGLAKAMEPGAGARASRVGNTLADSPTITTPAMTAAGIILGTAAYMSPEQARGKPVDRRGRHHRDAGRRGDEGARPRPRVRRAAAVAGQVPAERPSEAPPRHRHIEPLLDLGRARSASPASVPQSDGARGAPRLLPWAAAAMLAATTALMAWAPWRATPAVDRPLVRLDVELGPDAVRASRLSDRAGA